MTVVGLHAKESEYENIGGRRAEEDVDALNRPRSSEVEAEGSCDNVMVPWAGD